MPQKMAKAPRWLLKLRPAFFPLLFSLFWEGRISFRQLFKIPARLKGLKEKLFDSTEN